VVSKFQRSLYRELLFSIITFAQAEYQGDLIPKETVTYVSSSSIPNSRGAFQPTFRNSFPRDRERVRHLKRSVSTRQAEQGGSLMKTQPLTPPACLPPQWDTNLGLLNGNPSPVGGGLDNEGGPTRQLMDQQR